MTATSPIQNPNSKIRNHDSSPHTRIDAAEAPLSRDFDFEFGFWHWGRWRHDERQTREDGGALDEQLPTS